MSDQVQQLQELVTRQQTELNQLRATSERAAIDAAVNAGLDASGFEFTSPAARGQAAELLRHEISLVSAGGQTIAAGPGLAAAADHIKSRLAGPDFQHFSKAGSPSRTSTSSPAAPGGGHQPAAEPRTLGEAMVARMVAARAATRNTDPRMDMSRPFGLPGAR